jgi:hypothetical protein|tara:strand:+ start:452 stop:868 length:417 start_codon:yes stop_codon:yes gene_type:complete
MKCYVGGAYHWDEFEYHATCFANNRKEARKLLWYTDVFEACDGVYTQLRVVRRPQDDDLLDTNQTSPYVVYDNKTLRQMFYCIDGDSLCSTCGLFEMAGEYPVCDDCHQCPDCGHSCDKGEQHFLLTLVGESNGGDDV